jgi:DNA-binding MarR family transcriptional regulator
MPEIQPVRLTVVITAPTQDLLNRKLGGITRGLKRIDGVYVSMQSDPPPPFRATRKRKLLLNVLVELETAGNHQDMYASYIARKTGLDVSSTHHFLRTLARAGWLEKRGHLAASNTSRIMYQFTPEGLDKAQTLLLSWKDT